LPTPYLCLEQAIRQNAAHASYEIPRTARLFKKTPLAVQNLKYLKSSHIPQLALELHINPPFSKQLDNLFIRPPVI